MAPYTILYVDDEPDLLVLGKAFLETIGDFTIDTRESAPEGLDALRTRSYDAVISDFLMPGMNGLVFLKTVREEFGDTPFILFTGRGREDVVIEAINLGVDFYLQKGGDVKAQFAELAHKVKMAVERKRAVDEQIASEKRLSAIFHASPIHQMITDFTTDRIIDINDRFLKDLHLAREEVVGKCIRDFNLMPGEDQIAILKEKLKTSGVVRNVPITVRGSTGTIYTSLTSMMRVQVHGKDLIYTQSVDITAQKKAQQTINALLNAPPDVSMLLDNGGKILAVNEAASVRYKIPVKDLIGMDAFTLQSVEYAQKRRDWVSRAITSREPLMVVDDQTGRVFENHLYPVIDFEGNVTAVAVHSHDITDEVAAKEALRESEAKYRLVVEHSHDTIYIYRDDNFIFINRQAEDLTGFTHEELMRRDIWDFIHPDDRQRLKEAAKKRFAGGHLSSAFQAKILRKNGEVREGEFYVDLIDFLGKPAILGIARDITEKKQAEEVIRDREEQIRSLSDNLPNGLVYQVVIEPDGKRRFTHVSAGVEQIHEVTAEAMLQDPSLIYKQIAAEDKTRMLEAEDRARSTMSLFNYETRIRTPSGIEKWVLIRSAPRVLPNGGTIWDGIELDITAAKRAEEELRAAYEQLAASQEELQGQFESLKDGQELLAESEEKYRRLIHRTFDAVVVYQAGTIVLANDTAALIAGYHSGDEIVGKPILSFIHPDYRQKVIARQKQMLESSEGVVPLIPEKFVRADGTIVDVEVMASTTQYKGKPAIQVVFRDITERQHSDQALRESEENYRRIIEDMQDVFYRTDKEGTITMISTYGARLVGFDSPADIIGKYRASDFYVDSRERDALLTILMREHAITGYPITLRDRAGNLHAATASSRLIFDKAGNMIGVEGILHDVTQIREVEKALRQANLQITLLNSITRHDIRNQLLALNGWLELSRASIDDPDRMLDLITREQKIADVIKQQIDFTTLFDDMGVKPPSWQDPAVLARSSSASLPFNNVQLDMDLPRTEVFADPLFEKVFYNLFDNALRYGGDNLTQIRVHSLVNEGDLILIIEDNGVGIPDHEKERLFERGYGKNTGLGLFLAKEILAITGLTIHETGTLGKGARFEILVPKNSVRFSTG